MKYVDFADKIDEHFAAIQRLINEVQPKPEQKDEFGVKDDCLKNLKENLIIKCIALNQEISDSCAPYLESE